MELRDIWSALVRRWYFMVLVLIATVAAGYGAVIQIGPTYTATTAVLVFPPYESQESAGPDTVVGNPYLELNGVGQARDIVIRALSSKTTLDELAEQFPETTFTATPDFTNSAPIIVVQVESGDPARAVEAAVAMAARIPPELDKLQADLGLEQKDLITSRVLIADTTAEEERSDQVRGTILVAAIVLALGLLSIGLIDGLLERRRLAKESQPGTADKSGRRRRRATRTRRNGPLAGGGREDESPVSSVQGEAGPLPIGRSTAADSTSSSRT